MFKKLHPYLNEYCRKICIISQSPQAIQIHLRSLTRHYRKIVIVKRYQLLPTDRNSPILSQCAIGYETTGDTCINLPRVIVPSVTTNVPINELIGARLCRLDNQCRRSGVLHCGRTYLT